jgi:hypothetical protein
MDELRPQGDPFSFHTFEIDALAHLVALVVAHTNAPADAALDRTLNRVLAEHGVRHIKAFDELVGKHLEALTAERT